MKIKPFILLLNITLFLSSFIFGQEKKKDQPVYGWQKEMVGGLNLTQTSFDNWAQGGESSFAWQLNFNFKFVNDQEKTNWSNSGKLSFGSTKTGDQEARKSTDEIKLETVLKYKLTKYMNPFIAATAETQFAPGYQYGDDSRTQISAFMDPAYFRQSLGAGYKPNEIIKTRLGVALKQTVTNNYPVPYADDPETEKKETFKNEVGAESVTDINWKITDNSLITSKLELFSTFKALNETDVNWDTVFSTSISKYFNVNFNFKLFYDRDISPKRQIKQAIALGVTYSFI